MTFQLMQHGAWSALFMDFALERTSPMSITIITFNEKWNAFLPKKLCIDGDLIFI